MLTVSPVWHGRLRAARGLTNLLMQTLVIHPALLFFLLSAHHAGGAGQMLLGEAEKLMRDAPGGQVWGCLPQITPVTSLRYGAPAPEDLQEDPLPASCSKSPVSADAWAAQTSGTLLLIYKAGVLLSIITSLSVWALHRRAKGENA